MERIGIRDSGLNGRKSIVKMQLSIEGDVMVDASALQADDGRTWERLDVELPAALPGQGICWASARPAMGGCG